MILYLVNLLLAIIWAAVSGSFTLANLVLGFLLGTAALYLIREQVGSTGYFTRAGKLTSLAFLFFFELMMSGWRVLVLVLRFDMKLKPGIFAYPLKVDRDFEITLLANLISLTPGTLSVDVSADRRHLYIHALDASNPEQTRREIAEGFERRIMEAFR